MPICVYEGEEKNILFGRMSTSFLSFLILSPPHTVCSLWFTHVAAHLGFLEVFMLLENPVVSPGRSVQKYVLSSECYLSSTLEGSLSDLSADPLSTNLPTLVLTSLFIPIIYLSPLFYLSPFSFKCK
jgi:hypothetical protein